VYEDDFWTGREKWRQFALTLPTPSFESTQSPNKQVVNAPIERKKLGEMKLFIAAAAAAAAASQARLMMSTR